MREKSVRRALAESFVVELLNPKVAIFFIAFLPQFVDSGAALPVWAQFLILGMVVNLAFSSADLLTVFFASAVIGRLKQRTARSGSFVQLGGSLLIGLGARLPSNATDDSERAT